MVVCALVTSGCFPQPVPLAILPMEEPEAAVKELTSERSKKHGLPYKLKESLRKMKFLQCT